MFKSCLLCQTLKKSAPVCCAIIKRIIPMPTRPKTVTLMPVLVV
nr:MAG TPA: hypothetical protein [Caudoviricetes sp.]